MGWLQGADQSVRVDGGGAFGQLVHEPELGAPRTAVLLVDGSAFRALAIVVVVVLRKVVLSRVGKVHHPLQHSLGDDLQDVRMGQAKLGLLPSAHSANLREVFGMSVEELVGAHETEIRMGLSVVGVLPPIDMVRSSVAVVVPGVRQEVLVRARPGPGRVPPEERGPHHPIDLGN